VSGYILHPQVYGDLDEIREFIAEDNVDAAANAAGLRLRISAYAAVG
jgi:hypothetical protein